MKFPSSRHPRGPFPHPLPAARGAVDFEKDVKPILETNCVRCHNAKGTDYEEGKTDVDLSSKQAAFDVVSTIVPGRPEKSKLYTTVTLPDDAKKVMPPRNKVTNALARLSAAQTETLKQWILDGAAWPDGSKLVARKAETAAAAADGEPALVSDIYQRISGTKPALNEKEMLPYATTIPGSDVSYDMVPIPVANSRWAPPRPSPAASPTKARSTTSRSPPSGWAKPPSPGTNSSSSCTPMKRKRPAPPKTSIPR